MYPIIMAYRSRDLITIGSISSSGAFTCKIITTVIASMSFWTWIICTEVNLYKANTQKKILKFVFIWLQYNNVEDIIL